MARQWVKGKGISGEAKTAVNRAINRSRGGSPPSRARELPAWRVERLADTIARQFDQGCVGEHCADTVGGAIADALDGSS